jgi:hypothetical protein
MWSQCGYLLISNTHTRAMPPPRYIYTCAPHRFTHFKCKPLCSLCLDTVLITIKRGLNDSNSNKTVLLIESVNLSLVRANGNHLHNDSCLTCMNQKCWFGVVIESPWFLNPPSESVWAFKGYSRAINTLYSLTLWM